MSHTDKTDPFWVKQRRAKAFTQYHHCCRHAARSWQKVKDECDLPAAPYIERPDERFRSHCSWGADFGSHEWARMFAARPVARTLRREWNRSDRRGARDANRTMMREHRAGHDVNDDVARVSHHRHSGRWDWD